MKKKFEFTCLTLDGEIVRIVVSGKSEEQAREKFNNSYVVDRIINVKERQKVKLHVWNESAFKKELTGLHI